MKVPRQLTFWLAVGGMAIVADVVVNIGADKLGGRFPALRTLNNYRTGKES
ncbi:hypothetical protein [Cellulomonas sp. 73-145]|uniref:hypothetical protein n=1 Tax=Cellulomonas sp. 73-145 TaxID=1895739 RepID=UPI001AC39A2B|nr:hypothetical protein [Cellulomonas sp. 73-145]MBN9328097.1 hypothetical protein [Cellulomonas sp.]